MKALLLVGVSAMALTAGAASAGQDNLPMVMKSSHDAIYFTTGKGSRVLYDQANSSGFSLYAVASNLLESSGYSVENSQGADDFVIPGTGKHHITAIYASGQDAYGSGYTASNFQVTFYKKIKHTLLTLKVKVLKSCPSSPASDLSGDGTVLIDVSSCGVSANAGHDYSVSVQAITPSGLADENFWFWQTNRDQIGSMGWWESYDEGSFLPCEQGYYEPMKSCFPTSGIGPDFAFEILGK